MPFTQANGLLPGRFRSKAASSNFGPGQTGSVADNAPSAVPGHSSAQFSDVSSDVPSPGVIAQPAPVSTSGGGSAAGAADSGSADTASFDVAPGQPLPMPNIVGATKAVDPDLYQSAVDAVTAVITAEAAEPQPDFDAIETLTDVARTLSAAAEPTPDDSVVIGGAL